MQSAELAYAHARSHSALQQARPFTATVIEGSDHFVYANGVLCYTIGEGQIRLLDFFKHQEWHGSFDIRQLLRSRSSQARGVGRKYRFQPLHYAHGLVSCLYSSKSEQTLAALHWLIVIDVIKNEILAVYELDTIDDIWVRNTREWLYCGISVETDEDDLRSWVLFQLDARKGQWCSKRIPLPNMPHGDLGVGNAFEIFDGCLYGASSRMAVNLASSSPQAWNSFYYVFRFPLGDPDHAEVMNRAASWRRWPADGNVDDRWGSLQLAKEGGTGDIYLYESRREFLESRPQSQRTCYRKRIIFVDPCEPGGSQRWVSKEPDHWDSESFRDGISAADVHHGDDWYLDSTYTVREAPIRTYVPTCRTFLDVIAAGQERPYLHIRARPRNTYDGPKGPTQEVSLGAAEHAPHLSTNHSVHIWPSEQDLLGGDEQLKGLLGKLNPDTATQQLAWYADESFIVYALPRKRIAIISFDPSARVPHFEQWTGAGSVSGVAHCLDSTAIDVGGVQGSGDFAAVTPSTVCQAAKIIGLDFFWRPTASGP
ncbi:F-box domain-containing protein [Sarocladium implicatum]|nr:F-box domain-containing protein [Sarocladium implicatum]